MDYREKDERNICCALCSESGKFPKYGPKIHRFRNGRGDAKVDSYKVFPGIELNIYSVHMDGFSFGAEGKGNFMEIHHCREGRMEQRQEDGSAYIMPGDLSVTVKRQRSGEYSFPLCHYHGISICIDTDAAPECLSCFLEDVNIRPRELARRLCSDKNCFIIRSQAYIEHIFSELYSVPEECKKGYFNIKILELLFVLGSVSPEKNSAPALSLSKMQADLAKEAAAWLAENLDRQVSVSELSGRFNVSQTHLQNAFKGVYVSRELLYPDFENAVCCPAADPYGRCHIGDRLRIRIQQCGEICFCIPEDHGRDSGRIPENARHYGLAVTAAPKRRSLRVLFWSIFLF